MDVGFDDNEVQYEYIENAKMGNKLPVNIIANAPTIVISKEFKEFTKNKEQNHMKNECLNKTISINTHYIDPSDSHTNDEFGETMDKFIVNFYPCKLYACRIVLTNNSSVKQKIEILWRIPTGLYFF